MFVQDGARNVFPRPHRRRGWGRIAILTAILVVAGSRLAYGGLAQPTQTIVVAPGDTVWSIALGHYRGDPRPHVEAILAANHLGSPLLTPGQTIQIPRE